MNFLANIPFVLFCTLGASAVAGAPKGAKVPAVSAPGAELRWGPFSENPIRAQLAKARPISKREELLLAIALAHGNVDISVLMKLSEMQDYFKAYHAAKNEFDRNRRMTEARALIQRDVNAITESAKTNLFYVPYGTDVYEYSFQRNGFPMSDFTVPCPVRFDSIGNYHHKALFPEFMPMDASAGERLSAKMGKSFKVQSGGSVKRLLGYTVFKVTGGRQSYFDVFVTGQIIGNVYYIAGTREVVFAAGEEEVRLWELKAALAGTERALEDLLKLCDENVNSSYYSAAQQAKNAKKRQDAYEEARQKVLAIANGKGGTAELDRLAGRYELCAEESLKKLESLVQPGRTYTSKRLASSCSITFISYNPAERTFLADIIAKDGGFSSRERNVRTAGQIVRNGAWYQLEFEDGKKDGLFLDSKGRFRGWLTMGYKGVMSPESVPLTFE